MEEIRRMSNTPSRRDVLRGAAVAGVAAAGFGLAACGGGSGSGNSQGSQNGSGGTGSGTDTSTPSSGASNGGTDALGPSSDVPIGGGKIYGDARVVVTQPAQGDFKAFSAVCTHLSCIVGDVSNGLITCPCHGSQYSITDGSVRRGPAPAALAPKKIKISQGEIVLE